MLDWVARFQTGVGAIQSKDNVMIQEQAEEVSLEDVDL